MDETFDLLRRAAEQRRETVRRLHGGIDPATWQTLLDRVEDKLGAEDPPEEDDRDDATVPEPSPSAPLHPGRQAGPSLSLLSTGSLGTALAGLGGMHESLISASGVTAL
ncbi:hypothetical protein AB0L04_15480 [Streptomyces glaucescens]|uniref:hypothetical protein n=1 Tax=Streptomyces glaucescens TaxID=1907 RepID=UPI00344CAEDD